MWGRIDIRGREALRMLCLAPSIMAKEAAYREKFCELGGKCGVVFRFGSIPFALLLYTNLAPF